MGLWSMIALVALADDRRPAATAPPPAPQPMTRYVIQFPDPIPRAGAEAPAFEARVRPILEDLKAAKQRGEIGQFVVEPRNHWIIATMTPRAYESLQAKRRAMEVPTFSIAAETSKTMGVWPQERRFTPMTDEQASRLFVTVEKTWDLSKPTSKASVLSDPRRQGTSSGYRIGANIDPRVFGRNDMNGNRPIDPRVGGPSLSPRTDPVPAPPEQGVRENQESPRRKGGVREPEVRIAPEFTPKPMTKEQRDRLLVPKKEG